MHELGIAQTILKTALAELKKYPAARLQKAYVVIGRQHAILPQNMQFAYETLSQNTPAAGSELVIKIQEIAATCRGCQWQGIIQPPRYQCAACGQGDLELNGGDELYLESLEVETDEQAKH